MACIATRSSVRHAAPRQWQLANRIRREIFAGRLPPGSTLPPRVELCRRWNTTPVTLHKVVRQLLADGYLVTEPGRATRVAAHPPHRHRYGVVFHGGNENPAAPNVMERWTQFDATLYRAVRAIEAEQAGRQFHCYFHVDGRADSDDLQQLWRDVHRQRLAGLIFVDPPYWLKDSLNRAELTLPMTGLFDDPCGVDMQNVSGDPVRWLEVAVRHLKQRGVKRPAVLRAVHGPKTPTESLWGRQLAVLRRAWPSLPDHWVYPVHYLAPETIAAIVPTLLRLPTRARPDALIVTDEHLVEQVAVGLRAAGQLVAVVAHASFPRTVTPGVPMTFLGFDIPGVVRACLQLMEGRRANQPSPRLDPWRPLFEVEYAERTAKTDVLGDAAGKDNPAMLEEQPSQLKSVATGELAKQ